MRIKQSYSYFILLSLLCFVITYSSCKKDPPISDKYNQLTFSTDTVIFDTVFTTVGTVTKYLKVYNNNNTDILIKKIFLAGGNLSNFSLNIDGVPSNVENDLELKSKDSLFIFIRATIDPNNTNSPFIINDSILFDANGNKHSVVLTAWGQDAYYHTPNQMLVDSINEWRLAFSYAGCSQVWKNDKPHVIYGYMVVDTDSILRIPAGTQIYLNNTGVIWVYEGGSIRVYGKKDEEVIFQGDRLDYSYRDVPGQWGKIWLSKGSKNNDINYAIIKNGYIGIQVDSLDYSNSTLRIRNTKIQNMSITGIYGIGSHIEASNCVISECGEYAVVLSTGGIYDFSHCTIGNFWDLSSRKTPSLVINNYYKDITNTYQIRPLHKADFTNCIIYGNNEEELLLDSFPDANAFNYSFKNCIIKTEQLENIFFTDCIINTNPLFNDYSENDFSLNENSPAINKGIDINTGNDIDGNTRDIEPDIGAYEYIP